MFWNNFSKREKKLAIVTGSAVIIAAAFFLIIEPLSGRWKGLNNQIEAKAGSLEKDSALLSRQPELEREYAALFKDAGSAKSDEEAAADTLSRIENIARKNSCVISNIKPLGVKSSESRKEILIDVTAEGSIEQILKFMYDVENPRSALLNIRRFTISPRSGQPGSLKGVFFISRILLR